MHRSKIIWTLSALLALAALAWISNHVGYHRTTQFRVPLQIIDVSPQITKPKNWPRWYGSMPGHTTDSTLDLGNERLTLLNANPVMAQILWEKNGHARVQEVHLSADSFGSATRVDWIEKISLLDQAVSLIGNHDQSGAPVGKFRTFIQDPARYFGYNIHVTGVPDTLVITTTKMASKIHTGEVLNALYDKLLAFAASKSIPVDTLQNWLAAFVPNGQDSVMVMAGIRATGKCPTENGISFQEMPAMGKMLVGNYEGPYSGIHEMYAALQHYIAVKNLKTIAVPFERFLQRPSLTDPAQKIRVELHYPIL